MDTLLGGGQKQGRRNQRPMGAIAPLRLDLNGRYVNPIRIREREDYAHHITTSFPTPRIFRPSYGPASRGRGGHSHWLLMKTEKDKEQQCRWNYVRAVGTGRGSGKLAPPRNPILIDQITLFEPGGQITPTITTCSSFVFSYLPLARYLCTLVLYVSVNVNNW
jgi:hypothetical protein